MPVKFLLLLPVITVIGIISFLLISTTAPESGVIGQLNPKPITKAATTSLPMIGNCSVFPADNIWNTPVDNLPINSNSANYISSIGNTTNVHPDFGSGLYEGVPIGIPFMTVAGTQTKLPVSFTYSDESDPGPYPVPTNTPIEGGSNSTGDRHVLVVDQDNCILYELYSAFPGSNNWTAGSGAIYHLNSNNLRTAGWTSADAAGLPILPGLLRYDEIVSGSINHAVRFTASQTQASYIWPARHLASSNKSTSLPPMGLRVRLKSNFDISSYSPTNQIILKALKKYGMILADNGSSWYISGSPDERWDNDDLHKLTQIAGSNFEAVDESGLQVSADSGQVKSLTNDLYVSPTGSDSSSCSQSAACKTIQRAASLVQPGQTVHVAPGTYTNTGTNPVVTTNTSGTASSRIIFVSDTKWGAKLVSTNAYRVWMNNANYVDISGFDISATDTTAAKIGIQNEGSFVRTIGNRVHDFASQVNQTAFNTKNAADCFSDGGAGIVDSNYSASDNDMIGNVVFNIGNPQYGSVCWGIHGLYHSNLRGHIYNNITYNNESFGIHIWHAANNVTVDNNLSFHNGTGGIATGAGDAPGGITNDNSTYANNILRDNVQFGFRSGGGEGANNRYINNDIFNSGADFGNNTLIVASEKIGNISVDPQFVNYQLGGFASGGDYHLKSTSPLINAGVVTGAPTTDYDGVTRPQGSGFDIGPYEFLATVPTFSPSPTSSPVLDPTPPTQIPGDINRDRKVDIFDYNILVGNFNKTGIGIQGDIDGDGRVTIFDYNILVGNFGQSN